jgi:hypothetical protein
MTEPAIIGWVWMPALAALLLAGCDSPSPAFMRLPAQRIEVGGMLFSVRHSDTAAEAMRLAPFAHFPRGRVAYNGGLAILKASGCRIRPRSLDGDEAIVRARLDCSARAPPKAAAPR